MSQEKSANESMIHELLEEQDELRLKVLDKYAEGLTGSIASARSIALVGNLIALLLFCSLFNALFSWNFSQQTRRAQLVQLANEIAIQPNSDEVEDRGNDEARTFQESLLEVSGEHAHLDWVERILQSDWTMELAYLRHLPDEDALRHVAMTELDAHIRREKEQDRIHIPFVDTDFSATDRTIIAGLALGLAAVWLIGALGRQDLIMGQILKKKDGSLDLAVRNPYTKAEMAYILKSVEAGSAFSLETPRLWKALLVAPMVSVILSAVYFLAVGSELHLYNYWRGIIEILTMIMVVVLWIKALEVDRKTERSFEALKNAIIS